MLMFQVLHIVTKRLIFKLQNSVPRFSIPKVLHKPVKSQLFLMLQIFDDKIGIPICIVLARPDIIRLSNGFNINEIRVERNGLAYYAIIDWISDKRTLLIENLSVQLPSKIRVSIIKKRCLCKVGYLR